MSLIKAAVMAIRRLASTIGGWMPQAPSDDAPAPDIDGRRASSIDPAARLRVDRARKAGRGGYR